MDNNEIANVKEKYALSEEEFEEMYQKARKLIIGDCKPAEGNPTAIVTGGQPGAGKIGLVIKSKRDMLESQKETIIIDGDAYRGLYKNSIEIAAKYPELYSEITDKATGKITNRLLKEVVNEGYNFIFEGIMGKINIIDTLEKSPYKYNIIARLIATSREESLLSIFERYIVMRENIGVGRLATIEAHDIRYKNFTEVAKVLEGRNIEVEVYERAKNYDQIGNPNMIYKTSKVQKKYRTVEEALNEGRKKSYELCRSNIKVRLEQINDNLNVLCINNANMQKELENLNEILLGRIIDIE